MIKPRFADLFIQPRHLLNWWLKPKYPAVLVPELSRFVFQGARYRHRCAGGAGDGVCVIRRRVRRSHHGTATSSWHRTYVTVAVRFNGKAALCLEFAKMWAVKTPVVIYCCLQTILIGQKWGATLTRCSARVGERWQEKLFWRITDSVEWKIKKIVIHCVRINKHVIKSFRGDSGDQWPSDCFTLSWMNEWMIYFWSHMSQFIIHFNNSHQNPAAGAAEAGWVQIILAFPHLPRKSAKQRSD